MSGSNKAYRINYFPCLGKGEKQIMSKKTNGTVVRPLLATVAVIAAAAAMIIGGFAAFTASTSNTGNSFAAGTLTFSDNDGGTALITVSNLKPGDFMTRQIVVTNDGSLDANVAATLVTSGDLAPVLDVTVEEGVNEPFGAGTLASAGTLNASYDETNGTPNPWLAGASKTYDIVYTVQSGAGNTYQGDTATAALTFNATSLAGTERANGSAK